MDVQQVLHKRILVATQRAGYTRGVASEVEELKVLEASPTEKWLKVRNLNGQTYWKKTDEIAVVEILGMLEPNPNKEQ